MARSSAATLRPTGAGWATIGFCGFALAVGRATGITEFLFGGLFGGIVVVLCAVAAKVSARSVEIDRALSRDRVPMASPLRSIFTVSTTGRFPWPPVVMVDHIDGEAQPSRLLADPESRSGSGARTRTERVEIPMHAATRGLVRFGPVQLVHRDPLALMAATTTHPAPATLLVLPTITPLGTMSPAIGAQPDAQLRSGARRMANRNDEFEALREYVEGDDIRLVHWAASARVGQLVVREFEHRSLHRTLVVVDTGVGMGLGTGVGTGDSNGPTSDDVDSAFEQAVSNAASVLVDLVDAGEATTFIVGAQVGVSPVRFDIDSPSDLDRALDTLATVARDAVPASSSNWIEGPIGRAHGVTGGDQVVVCTAGLDRDGVAALSAAASTGVDVIVLDASRSGASRSGASTSGASTSGAMRWFAATDADQLRDAWTAAGGAVGVHAAASRAGRR